jgi:hypothetical protein
MSGTWIRVTAGPGTNLVPGIHVFAGLALSKTWVPGATRACPEPRRINYELYGGYMRFVVPSPAMTKEAVGSRPLYAHRHQNVERALGVLVLDECRRSGVGELEHGDFTFDLRSNIQQIA